MGDDLVKAGGDSLESAGVQTFKVGDVPLIVYTEIAEHFGIGEEESHSNVEGEGGGFWKRRSLNPEVIGFRAKAQTGRKYGNFYFELWLPPVHEDVDRTVIIEISAGPCSSGTWAYGRGNLMTESIKGSWELPDMSLSDPLAGPVIKFGAMVLFRASQIACDPRCVGEQYWEAWKNPGGNFTDEGDDDA